MTRLTYPSVVRAARRHCSERCFGYHSTWRFFRRTGLKGHPGWHTGYYRTALATWEPPAGRPARVLICGAADEEMLRVLARLIGAHRLHAHLIDACPTPLHLATRYAQHRGISLSCHQDHAPALTSCTGPYDLIVTDGLLSLLPDPDARNALVARFTELLDPDGVVLYTARIAGSTGVLEYDRLGRTIQAAAARAVWPGTRSERQQLARAILSRPSRPAPFFSSADVHAVFGTHFEDTRCYNRTAPHTLVLRLAPSVRAGQGSTSVGITARKPRNLP